MKSFFDFSGIQTPKLLGMIGSGREISDLESFQKFLSEAPDDFSIKRVSGKEGDGFLRIRRSDGELNHVDIWNKLRKFMWQGYLIEESIQNTEQLANLNPSSLNTFRVITYRNNQGEWSVICTYLKVGRPGIAVDNSKYGGITVPMSEDGVTLRAFSIQSGDYFSNHPDTNVPLEGINIEGFPSVIEFTLNACKEFPFMGTLGWDIALTDQGPVAIETGLHYHPDAIQAANGGIVTDEMIKELPARHMFSRWDRRFFYPGC